MKVSQYLLPIVAVIAPTAAAQTSPPAAQQADVEERLEQFYSVPADPAAMSRPIPKFDAATGVAVHPNAALQVPTSAANPLTRSAGAKATAAFRQAACRPGFTRHFKNSPCAAHNARRPRTAVQANDLVVDLVNTWMDAATVVQDLTALPVTGRVATTPWSDDYWRTQWGGTAYRYGAGITYKTYSDAIIAYAQPKDSTALGAMDTSTAQATIANWSPAEKYDFAVGDAAFTLTNEQKGEGKSQIVHGDVPDWMGICDGWSTAAVMLPSPSSAFVSTGIQGLAVQWYPADVRALTSLAWAKGDYVANNIGGRCETASPATYSNGRIAEQDCFDTNPATFHLALGNMIGVAHTTFIMDSSFDAEVWNQDVISYDFVYFNPLDVTKRSTNWQDVAVTYDAAFKAKDRFQNPLTRGIVSGTTYDDTGVKKVVGVIAKVTYNDEYQPSAAVKATADQHATVVYTYDLELSSDASGNLVLSGGEWQNNTHPDFLWLPQKTSQLTLNDTAVDWRMDQVPAADVGTAAAAASIDHGAPLCSVLTQLMQNATGNVSLVPCVSGGANGGNGG